MVILIHEREAKRVRRASGPQPQSLERGPLMSIEQNLPLGIQGRGACRGRELLAAQ